MKRGVQGSFASLSMTSESGGRFKYATRGEGGPVSAKKIGIVFGMENTFPPAVVEKINSMNVDAVTAEFVKMGGIRMDEPQKYAVIIDRISQDILFYRAYLKNAALHGTFVVNNPFWWTADDKFFNYSLASNLGVA